MDTCVNFCMVQSERVNHNTILYIGGVEYIIFFKINIYLFLNFIKIPIVFFIKNLYFLNKRILSLKNTKNSKGSINKNIRS
jgi:hypothetical protein